MRHWKLEDLPNIKEWLQCMMIRSEWKNINTNAGVALISLKTLWAPWLDTLDLVAGRILQGLSLLCSINPWRLVPQHLQLLPVLNTLTWCFRRLSLYYVIILYILLWVFADFVCTSLTVFLVWNCSMWLCIFNKALSDLKKKSLTQHTDQKGM